MESSADLDLLNRFDAFTITQPVAREAGVVDLVNMKWNSSECRLAHEYKYLYSSRFEQLRGRFDQ